MAVSKLSGQGLCHGWPRISTWAWTHSPGVGLATLFIPAARPLLHPPSLITSTDTCEVGEAISCLGRDQAGLPQEGAKLPAEHGGRAQPPEWGPPG